MNAVIYSINSKTESKYRIQFRSPLKPHKYKTIKIYNKRFYKDSFLMKQLLVTVELINFVQETYYWLRELFVCKLLISNDSRLDFNQNTAHIFFLHYFYDFTNRIYIFNQRVGLLIKNNPDFKTQELIKSRDNYNYVLMQTKFRMSYVHFNNSLKFRKSLLTKQTILTFEKKSKVEVFSLDYILSSCIKAFKTQEEVIRYIDNLVYNKLKFADKYKPKLVKGYINKKEISKTEEAIRSIRHKTFKIES